MRNEDLVNPAATMESVLSEATLLSDETVTWRGRPARLVVVRPALFEPRGEARVWLDENGDPLAMELSSRDDPR